MKTLQSPAQSDFLRIAKRLHAAQLSATTLVDRQRANAAFAEFLFMAGQGRLDYWIATRETDIDDSMAANPEHNP